MTTASAHTIQTEQELLAAIKAKGHGFATQAEARRLVRQGLVERISGKGLGKGNTPTWAATAALKATWEAEVIETAERMVTCLGGVWPVVEERATEVVIMRKGIKTVVPKSMIR